MAASLHALGDMLREARRPALDAELWDSSTPLRPPSVHDALNLLGEDASFGSLPLSPDGSAAVSRATSHERPWRGTQAEYDAAIFQEELGNPQNWDE